MTTYRDEPHYLLGLELDDVLEDFAFSVDDLSALGRAGYLAGQRQGVPEPTPAPRDAAPAPRWRRGRAP